MLSKPAEVLLSTLFDHYHMLIIFSWLKQTAYVLNVWLRSESYHHIVIIESYFESCPHTLGIDVEYQYGWQCVLHHAIRPI